MLFCSLKETRKMKKCPICGKYAGSQKLQDACLSCEKTNKYARICTRCKIVETTGKMPFQTMATKISWTCGDCASEQYEASQYRRKM